MIMVSVVVGAILLYLRRNADDRAGWCDCCSVRLQAPAMSSRGGEGGSGLGPWETRRAAAGSVCVCAEEAAGAGGGWEEAFAREAHQKAMPVSSKKKYIRGASACESRTHCSAQVFARCEWAQ